MLPQAVYNLSPTGQQMQEIRGVGQLRVKLSAAGKLKGVAASMLRSPAKALGNGAIAFCCCGSETASKDDAADQVQSPSPTDSPHLSDAQVW